MIEGFKDHICYLMAKRPHSKDILASYEALVSMVQDLSPSISCPRIDPELVEMKQKEGFPLFSREELPLDMECASEALKRFFIYLMRKQDHLADSFKRATFDLQKDDKWKRQLYSAILARDIGGVERISRRWGIPDSMLYFLAVTSLKPSLLAIRQRYGPLIAGGNWEQRYCPLCGSEPYMAYFDKKGKRYLHCELCGTEWAFPRVKCPFCQNEDQEELGYFEPEEERGLRVYFCRKCSRYIKTVDRRVFEKEIPLELEYLGTLHLDLLAEKEGFK